MPDINELRRMTEGLDIPKRISISGLGAFDIVVRLLEAEALINDDIDHCRTKGTDALSDAIAMLYCDAFGDMFTDTDEIGEQEAATPIYRRALESATRMTEARALVAAA